MTAFTDTVRRALVTYARDYNAGTLGDRGEVMAVLTANRPDKTRTWLWAAFVLAAAAVKLADAMPGDEGRAKVRDRVLEDLAPGGRS